jgi:hypothetical protein
MKRLKKINRTRKKENKNNYLFFFFVIGHSESHRRPRE